MDDLAPERARLTDEQAQALVLSTVAQHAESLLRVAFRHSLCDDDAHDAYQRSMEILLRRAPTLDPRTAHKWLHVVVKREAMEVRRARSEAVAAEDVDYDRHEARDVSSPEERALNIERATRAAEALQRLKPHEMRTIWLKAVGHSYREISSITGFSATNNSWQPYTALGSSTDIVDTCDYDPQVSTICGVGGNDWFPNDPNSGGAVHSYADLQSLSTTKVIAGILCRPNPDNLCGNGYSQVNAQVMIFSAFFTIADTGAPTVGTPAGQGWTADEFVSGDVPVTLASTDLTGIRETRAYVDGQLVATAARGCSYTQPRPCTDEPGATVSIPTAGLADGSHTLAVAAVDAAGNETRVTRSTPLNVDNHAPVAPVGLTSPAASSQTNEFSATWALPADDGTPIVAAHFQVCENGACGAVQPASLLTSVAGITLPSPGSGTLRVWLVDRAGHEDAANAATLTLSYAPPPQAITTPTPPPTTPTLPPPTSPTPPAPTVKTAAKLKVTTLRRKGRTVTVAGTLSSKASGRVTVRYRVKAHGRTHTLTKRVTIARHAFRTTVKLSPTYAASRTATVTVSYGGDADTTAQTRTTVLHTRA